MAERIYCAFNGDADGLCAMHQMRLWGGMKPDRLVTGVKRDIALLKRISELRNDLIYVFDVAIEKNITELKRLLENGCRVTWFDHHFAGQIPSGPNFVGRIDPSPDTNTAKIVAEQVGAPHAYWALIGLYGDNLHPVADDLARANGLEPEVASRLRELGELLNYNSYGQSLDDLTFDPAWLADMLEPFDHPLAFADELDVVERLRAARAGDLARAEAAERAQDNVILLPNESWARRVVGEFANRLARQAPDSAHAVLVDDGRGGYVVSVRSPLNNSELSAADLCLKFPTGGGRKRAAGINKLPGDALAAFIDAFNRHYEQGSDAG